MDCEGSSNESLGSPVSKSSSKQDVVAFQLEARNNSEGSLRQQKDLEQEIYANAYMTMRERVDFIIMFFVFGVLVAG